MTFDATPMKFLPDFRAWLTPNFSTTTEDDVVAALAVMMGSLRERFRYTCLFLCGIPSVTLLGRKEDYEDMMGRIQMIKDGGYGGEAREFGQMVETVLKGFLVTFDDPEGEEAKSFLRCMIWNAGSEWKHECQGDEEEDFEKKAWYHGWVTVFCYWNELGEVQLRWDEAGLPEVDGGGIPGGFTQVPLILKDVDGTMDAEMLAGSVGIMCSSSGTMPTGTYANKGAPLVGLDSLQPHICWLVYEKGARPSGDDLVPRDSDHVQIHLIPGG